MRPKVFSTIVAAFVTLFGLGNSAQADVVIEMVESTTGVTIIGSGSLQTLAGLTLNTAGHSPGTVPAQFQDFGTLSRILGGGSNDSDWYDTTFTTYTATTGGLGYGLNSSSAAISVGYFNPGGTDNRVYLPPGYAAGDSFSWTGFRPERHLLALTIPMAIHGGQHGIRAQERVCLRPKGFNLSLASTPYQNLLPRP